MVTHPAGLHIEEGHKLQPNTTGADAILAFLRETIPQEWTKSATRCQKTYMS